MTMPVRDSSLVLELNGAYGTNIPVTSKWADLSGNGYDGTLNGFGYIEGSGWTGESLTFDGVDDNVTVPNNQDLNALAFSIDTWVNVRDNPLGSLRDIIMKETTSGGFRIIMYENCLWFYLHGVDYATLVLQTYTAVGVNEINHIIYTYEDAMAKIYLNGALLDFKTQPGFIYITADIALQLSNLWHGDIYGLRYYNRVLAPAEVLQNYQAGYADMPNVRELISSAKPIVSSVSRIGTGTRTATSTVEPITIDLSRIGERSREVIAQISPITTGISKLLPPIKCNLSVTERLGKINNKERIGTVNTVERIAKIEVM